MSEKVEVGRIITEAASRDAIHVAIAPIEAAQWLSPGAHVGVREDGKADTATLKTIGIVDPYLREAVKPGQHFYLFLYPGTIRGLKHVWEHPAFTSAPKHEGQPEVSPDVAASVAWLKNYVRRVCPYDNEALDGGYGDFIDLVRQRRIFYHGSDCHSSSDVEEAEELYRHLSVVLGRKIDTEYFESFTCSC